MSQVTSFVICFLMAALRSRLSLQLEVAALRHQLSVYQGTALSRELDGVGLVEAVFS